MTIFQRTLISVLSVFLLFTFTLFRPELFVRHPSGVWLFKLIVFAQFFLLVFLFGRRSKVYFWSLLLLLGVGELAIWAYAHRLADGQRRYARGHLFFHEVVDGWDKNLIQYDPELSRFDSVLFYTLKPGIQNASFKSGFEVDTPIRTNRLGVRDDDQSLDNPAVIVLGDSFTMGWGVPDSSCFASVLERKVGQKVLNAGVSSFGTVREYNLFKRTKRDSCRVLIIQYCINDQPENDQLIAGTFEPSSRESYYEAVRYNALTADYYPFKYLHASLKACVQRLFVWSARSAVKNTKLTQKVSRQVPYEDSFFYAVQQIRKEYKGPIVITCLNPDTTTSETIEGFQAYLNRHSLSGIYLADVSDLLTPDDYFTLDNHINEKGHYKVADRLAEVINKYKLL
jgi:lysophospholipase L1-like esterase